MCGIVGAVAERNIVPILVEGLHRLEYRGYDSAGVAVIDSEGDIGLCRTTGKVDELEENQRVVRGAGQHGPERRGDACDVNGGCRTRPAG